MEICLPRHDNGDPNTHYSVYARYYPSWIAAACIMCLYLGLTFLTDVPDGCGRGKLDERCIAAWFYDKLLLGKAYLYGWPEWR